MGKHKTTYITIALVLLFVLALFAASRTLKRDRVIVLPEQQGEQGSSDNGSAVDSVNTLAVTPDTVQVAIGTLSRPASYERTQMVTIFWSGGESTSVSQVAVSGALTRIDTTLADSSVRHVLRNGETAAVWYDEEKEWMTLTVEELSADAMQRMPTYETVLRLSAADIAQAEYCERDGVRCLYVQTRETRDGYIERYWVSVDSGLLFAAERLWEETLIYRFTAVEPEGEAPREERFLLPDGTVFS